MTGKGLIACLVLFGTMVVLVSCGTGATPSPAAPQSPPTKKVAVAGGGSYTDVSAAGLAAMLKGKDFPLINVHIPYEGEIDGTDSFIPYNALEANGDKLPANKSAKLVLYCRSGSMSAIAARALVGQGYTDVWNLEGGMIGWQDAGYKVLNKQR